MNHAANFHYIGPGASVEYGGRSYKVHSVIDHGTVLAQDTESGDWQNLQIVRLQFASLETLQRPVPDIVQHAASYEIAQKRFEAIKPLLDNPLRSMKEVLTIATANGVSRATLYAWLRLYEDSPQLSSLIPRTRGRDKGEKKLDPKLEAIIAAAIVRTHRTKQRSRVSKTCEVVESMCKEAKLEPPHKNTVRARVHALPRLQTMRERGQNDEARDQFGPILGSFPGGLYPMSNVQMDHTQADCVILDDEMRLPLGRPWVTLAIDVCTRMVVGIYLSLEKPNAFAAGSCVAVAILPKYEFLAKLNIEGEWDVWGEIGTIHMDNAREFRGKVIEKACTAYGIDLNLRKVGAPHYGGHIERLMGTMANEVRNISGTTFSNIRQRKGYNSEMEAVMTFSEFEEYLVDWFINVYNERKHSSIGMTPAACWRVKKAEKLAFKPGGLVQGPPKDPERLRLDFMPFYYRTIERDGIHLDGMVFWHEVLKLRIKEQDPDNLKARRKFLLRQDPRDITRIWFLDPDTGIYKQLPTRNQLRPAVSLWEWRAVKKFLRDQGEKTVDENRMFEALARLRARHEGSVAKTKSARKQHQRAKSAAKHAKSAARPKNKPSTSVGVQHPSASMPNESAIPSVTPTETFEPFEDIDF